MDDYHVATTILAGWGIVVGGGAEEIIVNSGVFYSILGPPNVYSVPNLPSCRKA